MSYIEYKNIIKNIVVLATQKLKKGFCLPKLVLTDNRLMV